MLHALTAPGFRLSTPGSRVRESPAGGGDGDRGARHSTELGAERVLPALSVAKYRGEIPRYG